MNRNEKALLVAIGAAIILIIWLLLQGHDLPLQPATAVACVAVCPPVENCTHPTGLQAPGNGSSNVQGVGWTGGSSSSPGSVSPGGPEPGPAPEITTTEGPTVTPTTTREPTVRPVPEFPWVP
jgi:hypothetical protein